MGWYGSFSNDLSGEKRDILNDLQGNDWVVLAHKSTQYGRRFWLAVESLKTGEKLVMLYLFERHGNEWMYKPMDETVGPVYYDCPLSLLELTSDGPKDDMGEYAIAWRAHVRDYHQKRKNRNVQRRFMRMTGLR